MVWKQKIYFLFHLFKKQELNADYVSGSRCARLWRCKDVTTFTTSSTTTTNEDIAAVAAAAANKMMVIIANIYWVLTIPGIALRLLLI